MNWAYLHLTTNHFPIMVTAFGILALLWAFVTRRRAAWMYALATLAIAGLSAGPVYLAGDQAGDAVEEMKIVSLARLDAHEESAELAIWFLLGMGVMSAYGCWRMRRAPGSDEPRAWLRGVVAATALAGMAAITLTAQSGGKISHGDNTLTGKPSIIAAPPGPGDTVRTREGDEKH
jgi:formate hydrogenlyase subunit 3/multisubunit Na+/H+ antiporter MnhD subunit